MALLKHGDLKQIAIDMEESHWLVRAVASGTRQNADIEAAIAKKEAERLEEFQDQVKKEATTDFKKTA